jgi:hypothetical protein
MMWDAAALRYSRLGSADVEPTVKLRRIACQHFSFESLG